MNLYHFQPRPQGWGIRHDTVLSMNAANTANANNADSSMNTDQAELHAHDGGFLWLDYTLDEVTPCTEQWQNAVHTLTDVWVDDYHLSDILNPQHPSAFDLTDDYDFLIFRRLLSADEHENQVAYDARDDASSPLPLRTAPVSFVLTEHALITVRSTHTPIFTQLQQRIDEFIRQNAAKGDGNANPVKNKRLPSSPLDLCLKLLNGMIDTYLDLRVPLTARVQNWQTELLQGSHRFNRWAELLNESVALQQLENLCEEQIDALQELHDNFVENHSSDEAANIQGYRRDLLLVRLRDLLEHANRVENHALRLQAALKSAVDLHFSASSNDTNETMRFLAIVTVIFAPLTLLSGLYGMNFDIMPGLHNRNGFWFMLVSMVLCTAILLYYFRRRRLVGRGEKSVMQLLSKETDELL